MKRKAAHVSPDAAPAPAAHLDAYRQIVDGLTGYAIFALSADGRIATWNTGAKQTFGYDESEVIGQEHAVIFTDEDVAAGRPAAVLRAASQDGTSSVEGWHVRKDGSRFWCVDTVQPFPDASGALAGFTKIIRDSTENHSAMESLRDGEQRLRSLVESVTHYAIFSIDPDGNILLWNSGAAHIFGYREADVLGRHFSLIYTPDAIDRHAPEAEIARAAREGHAPDESWYVRKDGAMLYASGQMTRLLPDSGGKPRGFVKVAHDITARKAADETIKRQAFHDDLTQLPNRTVFTDCLRRAIARAKRRPKSRFAVIFIDLDRFKVINDSLGHALADGFLVHVARALEQCVRPEDVVARIGGDEFTILISDLPTIGDAEVVAERVQAALQSPYFIEGFELSTTASMGIVIGSPAYDQPEQVLRDADTAMYEAKARGRSRHVLFDSKMHSRAIGLLKLQMDLRRAIAQQEFCVEYQPIVSLEHCRPVGFEALVRWNHPERGLVAPADFIAEAENIGLIIQIDRWVLHEACRQIRAWQLQYNDSSLTVSVNLSGKQFAHDNLLAEIGLALRQNDLAPRSLKLEITETVLMERFEVTATAVAQIRQLGVELYIDDFGSGYSSLSYLTRFPLKLLKVDRSFVNEMSKDPSSATIVRTVVTLAHNLGLGALAEGIETEQQFSKLRGWGCEFGQGYWFSQPVAAAAAQDLIGHVLPRPPRGTAA